MIIIDTNVFSEYMSAAPAPAVERWRAVIRASDVYLTTVTRAEIRQGIAMLPPGRRRDAVKERADRVLEMLAARTLAFDAVAADRYGEIVAERARRGRPIAVLDAQIAAIAASHHASVATRDSGGFEGTGVHVINPWSAG